MVAKGILKELEGEVASINQALVDNLQSHVPLISEVGRHILLSGGKRIRPLLFLLSARMCGCQAPELPAFSTIFEYLHAATLLHDDVVDAADVRRGRSTANTIWGNQAVILVGDFLLSKALSLAVTTNQLRVLKVLAQTTTLMAEGEILQLLHAGNLQLTEEGYFEVTNRKTAILMSAACQIGAILGDSPPPLEEALAQFGLNLGITFQVVDDILDFTGNEQEMGKPIGNDLKEGRITLPVIHALAQAEPRDRERLVEMTRNLMPEMVPELRQLLDKYGSLDHARSQARAFTSKAQANLEAFPPAPEKEYFRAFTAELLDRTH
ncbi:MAG: polyprenyl synthetase family protein [Syntrophales bacterium]|nr:polyprenyl synthetase family protein [Syntrophales bacterium]MDD5643417.1 polyprenyl synthetase family protein [Syntrophales bacterium]